MIFSEKKDRIRWAIILASIVILGLFLWSISLFFIQLKKEERKKMEIWVEAQTQLINEDNLENSFNPILLTIIENNTSTPMVLHYEKEGIYEAKNVSKQEELSQKEIKNLALRFKQQYRPIQIESKGNLYGTVYYGNSSFITKTKYFPLVVIIVILLFSLILYYFYTISKSNEQNKLWAGMAKETAHQIGTPLSSLVGWIEILKMENIDPEYLKEMAKDIDRLDIITHRFSKIGSQPTLNRMDLVKEADQSFDYIKKRSSKLIRFSIEKPQHPIYARINPQLIAWTIENLVKNAIDAAKGRGEINLKISENKTWALLYISDTGKGIPKKDFKKIFKPGETSKKRGWGLGLSLAKRIIEEYHLGKIKVLKSEVGKGTTFEIKLRKSTD